MGPRQSDQDRERDGVEKVDRHTTARVSMYTLGARRSPQRGPSGSGTTRGAEIRSVGTRAKTRAHGRSLHLRTLHKGCAKPAPPRQAQPAWKGRSPESSGSPSRQIQQAVPRGARLAFASELIPASAASAGSIVELDWRAIPWAFPSGGISSTARAGASSLTAAELLVSVRRRLAPRVSELISQ